MIPSSNDLQYFLEIASTLNISHAAERLGISQPSLTIAIRRLEECLGTTILIRHKRGVSLTQAGKQLLMHSRQLIRHWEKTRSQALASSNDVHGYFTLGCNTAIAIYCISKILPSLLERYPGLEIHLKHEISRKITEQIINLNLDVGIVINPRKHPELIIRKLGNDEVTLWRGTSKNKIADINSDKAVIICNPELMQTQNILKQLKKQNGQYARMLTTSSLEVVANLTANGCGIGILPNRVAMSTYPDKLKRIANMPMHIDEICLIMRHESRQLKAVQVLCEAIKQAFKESITQ